VDLYLDVSGGFVEGWNQYKPCLWQGNGEKNQKFYTK
jgi:hypothetical protein